MGQRIQIDSIIFELAQQKIAKHIQYGTRWDTVSYWFRTGE